MAPKVTKPTKGKNTKTNPKQATVNVTTIQGTRPSTSVEHDSSLGSGTPGVIPGVFTPLPNDCLGFFLNNTKTDFTVLILHVHSIQNWFWLNPTCGLS